MKKVAKGFTLIELMIVVAIIGILAAIAIPNFIKYQLRSKYSEASSNIEGLRKAQEALAQGERMVGSGPTIVVTPTNYAPGQYWNLGGVRMPAAGNPGTAKMVWAVTDLERARLADWQVEGATYFAYQVAHGCPGSPVGDQSGRCYAVGAISDIDGDANNAAIPANMGNAALSKPFIDPVTNTITTIAVPLVGTVFPGTVAAGSTCIDRTGVNPVYGMPCNLSRPDVF
jgi:type IV pilus assembly protein PilA